MSLGIAFSATLELRSRIKTLVDSPARSNGNGPGYFVFSESFGLGCRTVHWARELVAYTLGELPRRPMLPDPYSLGKYSGSGMHFFALRRVLGHWPLVLAKTNQPGMFTDPHG